MSLSTAEFWSKASQIRDRLADQFLHHPDVSLIDLGSDPEADTNSPQNKIVIRLHLRRPLSREALGVPIEIEGIPVRLVVADYKFE